MTIEIADRLVKLRKKYGYSQEELADKLGLSRQAVSKWERAEASPDTDNLICLAKLYGVSLDELLATDDDVETIVNEQVKEDKKEDKVEDPEQTVTNDRVVINDDGIYVSSKDGKKVIINDKGVHRYDSNGHVIKKEVNKPLAVIGICEGALYLLAIVAYILLGSLANMWYNAWIVFFVPEILCSIARAILKKNAHQFNMPFFATFTFFFVCMVLPGLDANLWHPMWVVFLAVPIYYTSVSGIEKALGIEHDVVYKDEKDEDDDD